MGNAAGHSRFMISKRDGPRVLTYLQENTIGRLLVCVLGSFWELFNRGSYRTSAFFMIKISNSYFNPEIPDVMF